MPPTRYYRMAVSIHRELAAYRAMRRDLDTMGQAKCGTAWHRDQVRQREGGM